MRILLVTTWYPSVLAPGSGVFVQKDAELLSQRHDVRVLHLGAPDLLSAADAAADARSAWPVVRVPMSSSRPSDWRRAWGSIASLLPDADVLHTQAFSALLPFAGRAVSLPWVHTEHWSALSNPETVPLAWRAVLPVLTRLLRRPDVVTSVCEYLADPIRRIRTGAIRIVPCIVPPAEVIVPLPGDAGAPRLVAIGGLLERKDPLCAVDALALVRASGIDAGLTWVGDGPLRDAVVQRARERGVEDSVRITGVLDAQGVVAQLEAADVFLLPTKGENFCVSAAEAIVRGRPVVVGANGGQREYVDDRNGVLVHEQSAPVYAAGVMSLLAKAATADATEIAATIGDRFSPARVLEGYEDAYAEAALLAAGH